mgnify:FL=1
MTYDSPEDQERFTAKHSLTIPLVSDIDGTTVRNLGLFNDEFAPDHFAYGVPHPGFFVLSPTGIVRAKSFLTEYDQRLEARASLAIADGALPASQFGRHPPNT